MSITFFMCASPAGECSSRLVITAQPTLHRRVDGGVVRAQPLLEERREERAVHQVVEDGRVGQVAHEVDLPVEDRLQLLEPHDERAVEAGVLVQRRRDVDRIALAGGVEQIAQPAVERHADLVRHAEGEHRQLGPLEALRVEDRARAEQLLDVRAQRLQLREELAVAAVDPRRRGDQPLLDLGAVERVQKQLELARPRTGPQVEIRRIGRV